MAGHSHWAGIKHKKGVADKKRGKLFGKLSRAIIVAAQQGGGDPDMNLTLRYAIDRARKASMPKDNIDRAVQKGCGEAGGVEFTEILYEGYGVGGVAVMCEALTDNRNRTAGEVRKIFEKRKARKPLDQGQQASRSALEDPEAKAADPKRGLDEDLDDPALEKFQQPSRCVEEIEGVLSGRGVDEDDVVIPAFEELRNPLHGGVLRTSGQGTGNVLIDTVLQNTVAGFG